MSKITFQAITNHLGRTLERRKARHKRQRDLISKRLEEDLKAGDATYMRKLKQKLKQDKTEEQKETREMLNDQLETDSR